MESTGFVLEIKVSHVTWEISLCSYHKLGLTVFKNLNSCQIFWKLSIEWPRMFEEIFYNFSAKRYLHTRTNYNFLSINFLLLQVGISETY